MKKLMCNKIKLKWPIDDISKRMVMYSAGPRDYRVLLKKRYPFPAVSTLKSWLKKIKILPGIMTNIFKIVKSSGLSKFGKICVLSFDEMKISKAYSYDRSNDETLNALN